MLILALNPIYAQLFSMLQFSYVFLFFELDVSGPNGF